MAPSLTLDEVVVAYQIESPLAINRLVPLAANCTGVAALNTPPLIVVAAPAELISNKSPCATANKRLSPDHKPRTGGFVSVVNVVKPGIGASSIFDCATPDASMEGYQLITRAAFHKESRVA